LRLDAALYLPYDGEYCGLSKTAVYNAANLAMFKVNLSSALLQQNSNYLVGSSVNDLKV